MLKMKNFLAITMAATMLLSSTAMFASALDNKALLEEDGSYPIAAEASTIGAIPGKTYSVNDPYAKMSVGITWDDPEFTYNFGTHWNPEQHHYEAYVDKGEIPVGWEDSIKVVVTNRSNCDVRATATFTKDQRLARAMLDIDADFDFSEEIVEAAVDGAEHKGEFILSATGQPQHALENVVLGTITIDVEGV